MRPDILIAVLVTALCGVAVALQLQPEEEIVIQRLELGEVLDVEQTVVFIADPPFRDTLATAIGTNATVYMTWSVPCPCVEETEPRLQALAARYGAAKGVAWIAVDGEPYDTAAQVREKMATIGSFYPLVLDPNQRLIDRFGLEQASQVAVFDAAHRLVYRGPFDFDYDAGQAEALERVLARLLGETTAPGPGADREATYGCYFNDPASCQEYIDKQAGIIVDKRAP